MCVQSSFRLIVIELSSFASGAAGRLEKPRPFKNIWPDHFIGHSWEHMGQDNAHKVSHLQWLMRWLGFDGTAQGYVALNEYKMIDHGIVEKI